MGSCHPRAEGRAATSTRVAAGCFPTSPTRRATRRTRAPPSSSRRRATTAARCASSTTSPPTLTTTLRARAPVRRWRTRRWERPARRTVSTARAHMDTSTTMERRWAAAPTTIIRRARSRQLGGTTVTWLAASRRSRSTEVAPTQKPIHGAKPQAADDRAYAGAPPMPYPAPPPLPLSPSLLLQNHQSRGRTTVPVATQMGVGHLGGARLGGPPCSLARSTSSRVARSRYSAWALNASGAASRAAPSSCTRSAPRTKHAHAPAYHQALDAPEMTGGKPVGRSRTCRRTRSASSRREMNTGVLR